MEWNGKIKFKPKHNSLILTNMKFYYTSYTLNTFISENSNHKITCNYLLFQSNELKPFNITNKKCKQKIKNETLITQLM